MTWARALVTATFETKSLLHIGSGATCNRLDLTADRAGASSSTQVDVAAVAVGHDPQGREVAAIPASAIRGVLRSLLRRVDPALLNILFGTIEDTDDVQPCAGRLTPWDAFIGSATNPACPPPLWDATRRTGVYASTVVDDVTGAATKGKLRHLEVVPRGQRFDLFLALRTPDENDMIATIALLQALGNGATRLGSNTADGWGAVSLLDGTMKVRVATEASVQAWLARGAPDRWTEALVDLEPGTLGTLTQRASERAITYALRPEVLSADMTLKFHGPLMIGEPRKAKVLGVESVAKTARVATGEPVLPADSFRGRMRSQAMRILRTRVQKYALAPDTQLLVDALFGSRGGQSALLLEDFLPVAGEEVTPYDQQFVAIDRFTGGAADRKLFQWSSTWKPVLTARLAIDMGHFRGQFERGRSAASVSTATAVKQATGLLALVLRDLREGDIAFGAGRAKGYGKCTATVHKVLVGSEVSDLRDLLQEVAIASAFAGNAAQAIETAIARLPFSGELEPIELPEQRSAPEVVVADVPGEPGAFRNPYHFVPLSASTGRNTLDTELTRRPGWTMEDSVRNSRLSRHRWRNGTVSGQLTCDIRAVTPVVIGGRREPAPPGGNTPSIVHPVVDPTQAPGQQYRAPMVPGSSIRGMITAVHEAATNSSLRVLDDRLLTHRAQMTDALPYIGMLQYVPESPAPPGAAQGTTGTPAHWCVRPVCLGPLLVDQRGRAEPTELDEQLFPEPSLRVSLSGGAVAWARVPENIIGTTYWSLPGSHRVNTWATLTREPAANLGDGQFQAHLKRERLLGMTHNIDGELKPWAADIHAANRGAFIRGRLLVLGVTGVRDLPGPKTHELFLPWPAALDAPDPKAPHVSEDVIERFHALAALQFDETVLGYERLPYEPVGQRRNGDEGKYKGRVHLKDGDLVWFRAALRRGTVVITRLALSSIWRATVGERDGLSGSVHKFFESSYENSIPYDVGRTATQASESLDASESVFGVVSASGSPGAKGTTAPDTLSAYASRLAFSFGNLTSDPANCGIGHAGVTLKILGNPKPPSPALYFRANPETEQAIAKEDLFPGDAQEESDPPNGRKFYLHQKSDDKPWLTRQGTDRPHLKSRVTPLSAGTTFSFTVEFDGLSLAELGHLLFALNPSDTFCHKIGMGKPIGLGTVKLSVKECSIIDRRARYSNVGWRQLRAVAWSNELTRLRDNASYELADLFPDAYRALRLIGESLDLTDVTYPVTNAQNKTVSPRTHHDESKLFEWFRRNARGEQVLEPLDENSTSLPRLKSN